MVSSNHRGRKSLTLVIAVYNAVRYLEYILVGLEHQTIQNFEVIVADDGSGPEIGSLIERMASQVSFPIQHLRQEDAGFRKNMMLNRAIAAARTDYLVFIDGDCLPHREFLRDHWRHRSLQTVLCGRRVNLSKQLTDRITLETIRTTSYQKLSLPVLWDGLMARSSNLEDGVRINNEFIRRILHRNQARILGCNFSLEKSLLEQVNGFNEDYHAPGIGEDTDIAFRLSLIGAKFSTLRYQAVLFHLYHPVTRIGDNNRKIFEDVERLRRSRCINGLKKLEKV